MLATSSVRASGISNGAEDLEEMNDWYNRHNSPATVPTWYEPTISGGGNGMERIMVLLLFFIGILLIATAVIALFRKVQPGEGSVEFAGVKLSGKGAPVFLLSGVFFSYSGYGWYHSLNQVHTLAQTVAATRTEKNEYAEAAATLASRLEQEARARRTVQAELPPERLQELERREPTLLEESRLQISPRVAQELRQRGIHVPQ
jgi:hypothetical protein